MISDEIDYKLIGDDMQLVEIELDPNEGVRAEAGAMLFLDDGIQMQTTTGGGAWKGFKRMLTGDSFFITTFLNSAKKKQKVAFAAPYPGKIIPLRMSDYDSELFCQKDSFLCAAQGTDIDIAFTKRLGTGFFGGEGFILQHITGNGLTFIHAGGTVIKRELKKNESLRVDTGCLVAFTKGVDYDIKFIGGFKNALFGGEGIFLVYLTGPGTVFLQSLPFSRLADRIFRATWRNREEKGGVAGIGETVLGGILGGDKKW